MSAALLGLAEVEKLARTLGLDDPDELEDLLALPPEDVRALRNQVTDMLLAADHHHFARVANLAKALPAQLSARIAEGALGPLLAARVAGLLDLGSASAITRRLSAGFLADVGVELDPRQASDVIGCLPADLIATAAAELDARGEHIAMGMFVGYLSDDALAAVLDVLSADALLRVGFLLEAPERLDEIVAQLPDACLREMAELADAEGREHELEGIAAALSARQRKRLKAVRSEAA